MNAAIDITEEQRKILVGLLHRYLPDVEVWAYGSRVKWTARPNSDLDLVAFAVPGLESQVAELKDALAESDLPFLVDLHAWDDIPKRFHEIIRKEYVVLQKRKGEPKPLEIVPDWTAMRLGSVTRFTSGGTPSKQNAAYWSGCIPWLSAKDMKSYYIDDTEDHISDEGLDNGSRLAPAGTVFLLARGMTLLNDVPICVSRRPMAFNQDVKGLTADEEFLIPEFLPYLLLGHKATLLDLVDLAGHGTGRLNTDELKSLTISVPSKAEQRVIANVLRSLDDKIEMNRKMNETLKATARELFQSWFVDFDPVHAKAEGREHGLSTVVADLFPERFEDSNMGPIPAGWSVEQVGNLTEVSGGTTPSTREPSFWTPAIHAWATPKDLSHLRSPVLLKTERYISESGLKQIGAGLMPQGTVLMSSRAPIGYIAVAELPVAINQGFIAMKAKEGISNLFLLVWVTISQELIKSRANGSTFLEISKSNFRSIELVRPPDRVIKAFDRLVRPMYERLVKNEVESGELAATRDSLLPKLISGELRMNH
jgi:type I restriction enzyme S subunit